MLFVVYPVAGFILGSLTGAAVGEAARRARGGLPSIGGDQLRVAGVLTLIGVYILNAVTNLSLRTVVLVVPMVNAMLLASALIAWAKLPNRLPQPVRFVAQPFPTAAILLGVPWLAGEAFPVSPAIKAAIALACWIAILAVTAFCLGLAIRRPPPSSGGSAPRRKFWPLAAAAVVTLAASFLPNQAPYAEATPQVLSRAAGDAGPIILLSLDTVRADHLSIYGYGRDTTPHLRRLLQDATLYTRAVASSDMTLSSHASIFTGLYASWHGAYRQPPPHGFGRPLAPERDTLAEILARAGLQTFGVVSNYAYLGHQMGLTQGFGYYDYRLPARFLAETAGQYLREGVRALLAALFVAADADPPYRTAAEINREVLALLGRMGEDRRFLLFVNYMDAHWPYVPPPPFDARFPGKQPDLLKTTAEFRRLEREVMSEHRTITSAERRHLESQYDGAIAYVDAHVGELLARLKQLGLYERSLIIVTSDHGEAFGDRNLLEHGVSVYQDQVHVPLVVKFPNGRQGENVQAGVSSVDLLPTILDILGLPVLPGVHGRTLRSAAALKDRSVISESFPAPDLLDFGPRFHHVQRALFADVFKVVTSTSGKTELYDLRHDKNETRDLAPKDPQVAERLETALNEWVSRAGGRAGDAGTVDPQTLERLKALGYVR